MGRGTRAGIGALIGFGGGFAIGAAAWGCHPRDIICVGRGAAGGVVGGLGAVIGGAIGALLPPRNKELIYSAK
jgi:hypothetical protein